MIRDMNKLQTLKGFRDFYPEDQAFQAWFYENLKEVSESFGFQEYEGPTLEPLALYAAKSGEELVKKQAFTLKDKGGNIIALRPEMTPTLARMVAQKENSLTFPIRWFTFGRRFRYETPQKGRGREFLQWDIDILGSENSFADAEIIAVAATFYKKIGLTPNEVKIKINDRQYLTEALKKSNIPENKIKKILKIIDKKAKVENKIFVEMLKEAGLSNKTINKLFDILRNKEGYRTSTWLMDLFESLNNLGVVNYVEFDPTVVRGLDYYTRTVFEGWDVSGTFRSIWGGGRYDNLTQDVGSTRKIPGVGFAMGDMVLKELLNVVGKYPKLTICKTRVLVTVFSPELLIQSIKMAKILREKGVNTEIYPEETAKLDKQLKYADKKDIPWVVIIGPKEVLNNTVVLKNLKTKSQETVPSSSLLTKIK